MFLTQFIQAIGSVTLLFFCFKTVSLLYLYNRRSSLARYLREGSYALVTGASDGIGLGFTEELLARGFNVILHGRNPEKLKRIQSRLRNEHPNREVAIAVADASRYDGDIHKISDTCKGKSVTVLVNNVGGAFTVPKLVALCENEISEIDEGINLNARFPVQLTRALLPSMAEDGPSLVMNVGSGGGPLGMPHASVYSGSKSFNMSWSSSMKLEMEMLKWPVEFLGIQIALVKSAAEPDRAVGFFIPSSRQFAAAALDRVGCGRRVVWPWWPHVVVEVMLAVLPEKILDMIMKAGIRSKMAEELENMRKLNKENKA